MLIILKDVLKIKSVYNNILRKNYNYNIPSLLCLKCFHNNNNNISIPYKQSLDIFQRNNSIHRLETIQLNRLLLRIHNPLQFILIRTKYQKRSSTTADDDSDDDDDLAQYESGDSGKDAKVIKSKLQSLRTDVVIKSALGIARNKIEVSFYENKIRVNGKKITKKSLAINVGDEIDLIRNQSPLNTNHLIVSRIEILSTKAATEHIIVIMRRYKSLTIENYAGANAWKVSEAPDGGIASS